MLRDDGFIGMRHRLVHDSHIDIPRVWDVAIHDIPSLLHALAPFVPPEQ